MNNKEIRKITITLDEESFVSLVFAAAQSSCGFNRESLTENPMWHLQCCDYNQAIYEALEQVNLEEIQDSDYRAYLEEAINQGREFFSIQRFEESQTKKRIKKKKVID